MEELNTDVRRRTGGLTAVVVAVVLVGLAFTGLGAFLARQSAPKAAPPALDDSALALPVTAPAPAPPPTPPTTAAPQPHAAARPAPNAESARGESAVPAAVAAPAVVIPPAAGPYAFVQGDRGDGKPARWDPCTPIHVVVNPTAASDPAAAVTLLRQALAKLTSVTGLQFVVDGVTTLLPSSTWGTHEAGDASGAAYPRGWAPVLVAWSRTGDTDQLDGTNSGFGGPVLWHDRAAQPISFVSGSVAVDANATAHLPYTFGPSSMGALLLHELGHVVGLGHVNDPTQIMNHVVSVGTFGSGDLAGLALLGRAQGCFSPPKAPW